QAQTKLAVDNATLAQLAPQIAQVQAQLAAPNLTPDQTKQLQDQLTQLQGQQTALQQQISGGDQPALNQAQAQAAQDAAAVQGTLSSITAAQTQLNVWQGRVNADAAQIGALQSQ